MHCIIRLAYSVWIIDQLIDRHSPECNKSLEVYVMYDIACTLKKYLEVRILSMYVYSSIATYYFTFAYRVMEDLIFWRKFTFPCLLFMHMGTKHHARYIYYLCTYCMQVHIIAFHYSQSNAM